MLKVLFKSIFSVFKDDFDGLKSAFKKLLRNASSVFKNIKSVKNIFLHKKYFKNVKNAISTFDKNEKCQKYFWKYQKRFWKCFQNVFSTIKNVFENQLKEEHQFRFFVLYLQQIEPDISAVLAQP